jgi:hypothetical protein
MAQTRCNKPKRHFLSGLYTHQIHLRSKPENASGKRNDERKISLAITSRISQLGLKNGSSVVNPAVL